MAAAVATMVAGCSLPIAGSATAAAPQDRDGGAVVAALRELSACALIDPAVAGRVGIGSAPIVYPVAPHTCTISAAPSSGDDEVTVRLGVHINHFIKWSSALITLAGAKAYRYDDSLKGNYCAVFIPVSFDRAIGIYTQGRSTGSDIDLCAASTAFAEAAATKLANPDSLRPDRTTFPMSQWDGCSVLAAGLGAEAGRYTLTLDEGVPGLDACDASTGTDPELSLKLSYGWPPVNNRDENPTQISGRTVDIAQPETIGSHRLGCRVRWSNGPASAVRPFTDQIIELDAPECPRAEKLAAAVMAVLDATPPVAAAQRPLLYQPDEPDTAAIGPCVDAFDGDQPDYCTPYRDVAVPQGAKEIITAGQADPNVECAVALEPVRKHLGAQMVPTTDGSSCRFVEPTHAVHVEVNFSGMYVPDRYGTEADLHQNRKKIDVSGHPAIYFEFELPGTRIEYNIFASPGYDTSAPGFVHAMLSLELPRGAPSGAPIDTTRAPLVEKIMADLMSTHFG